MYKTEYLVIGAGPAGLAAANTLRAANKEVLVVDKSNAAGGLCSSFTVNGCHFDNFVHLSFADDKLRNSWLSSDKEIKHLPEASNFYNGKWIKHPAIKNLAPLSIIEKCKTALSFLLRSNSKKTDNYYDWTKHTFGKYFADNFTEQYTRKYWGISGKEMTTDWIGPRFEIPTFDNIINGFKKNNTKFSYYTKAMYYPKYSAGCRQGFKQYFNNAANGLNIKFNLNCVKIDPVKKICKFSNGKSIEYKYLISTMPLPEILMCISDKYKQLSDKFRYTSGIMMSMVFDKQNITDKLWFYVYDKDIPMARCYSPSLCQSDNPEYKDKHRSTLQAEIYYAENGINDTKVDIGNLTGKTLVNLSKLGIDTSALLVCKVTKRKYANIIYDKNYADAKKEAFKILKKFNIISCGRFGDWSYLWSHQAWQSGENAAKQLIK